MFTSVKLHDWGFTVVLYWMVLKRRKTQAGEKFKFYSSVILNGTETRAILKCSRGLFYSSVILNGTETRVSQALEFQKFYSSVILNGTET